MRKEGEEIMELRHEPVPGFKAVFYIVLTVAVLYLSVILFKTI